jgi:hypothetical protein
VAGKLTPNPSLTDCLSSIMPIESTPICITSVLWFSGHPWRARHFDTAPLTSMKGWDD